MIDEDIAMIIAPTAGIAASRLPCSVLKFNL